MDSADEIDEILLIFAQKIGFDISCKLSPKKTICMKCQIPFSGKNQKNMSKCLLKCLPRVLSVNKKVIGVLSFSKLSLNI